MSFNKSNYIKTLNLQLFLIVIILFSIYRFSKDSQIEFFQALPNNLEIIAPLQLLRGHLEIDLLANALANSPALRAANFINTFLPDENLRMFASFINLSKIMYGITISMIVYLISNFIILIISDQENNIISQNKIINNSSLLISTAVIGLSLKGLQIINNNSIFNIASFGWKYPPDNGFKSSGISLIFILIAILLPILISNKFISSKSIHLTFTFLICLLSYSFAVYFHPQLPLGIFTILLPIKFFFLGKNQNINFWNKLILSYLIIAITNTVIVNNIFSSSTFISNNEFFRIYVQSNLSVHYLPSFYLNQETIKNLIINFSTVLILFFTLRYFKLDKRNNFAKLFLIGLIIALSLTFIQYFFVEFLKIPLFIKLGVSRFTYSYGFFYISSIVYAFSKIVNSFLALNLNKNNYFRINILSQKIFISSLSIILIFKLFSLMNSTFVKNYNFLRNSPVIKLEDNLNKNNLKNKNIVFLNESERVFNLARIIGKLNIYHDDRFPFNVESMIEWDKRERDLNDLNSCLKNKSGNDCFENFEEKEVIFVSKTKINNLKLISNINVQNRIFYIYGT